MTFDFQAHEQHEEAVDQIITVTDRLFSSVGDAHEMVRQARYLAQVNFNHLYTGVLSHPGKLPNTHT